MRSMPAPMRLAASSSAASTSGSRRVTPEPRPGRLAEHVDRLATHGPLRVDPLDRGGRQTPGLDLGHDAPVGLAKQLGLEREVDRPRGDVQRELLRLEVVLEQGHRERQGDARPEAVRVAGQPAVDRGPGQRAARRIEPADPEQAQDRPLLADRRRGPGPRAPRPRQRLCPRHERVERPPIRGHAGQYGVPRCPSRRERRHAPWPPSPVDRAGQPVPGQEASIRDDRIVGGVAHAAVADPLGARHDRGVIGLDSRAGSRPR